MKINHILNFALFSLASSSFVTASNASPDSTTRTLHDAAREGSLEEVQQILNAIPPGAIVDIQDQWGIFSNSIQN